MKKINVSFVVLITFILLSNSFVINSTSAKEKDVEIVQNLYAAFAKGDAPAVLQKFNPKIEWNEAENFPYADGNPYIGPQAVLEGVFARIGAEWEYWNLTEQTYYEANSGEINVQFVHIWTLNDGLVTNFQQYADTFQTVEAMK